MFYSYLEKLVACWYWLCSVLENIWGRQREKGSVPQAIDRRQRIHTLRVSKDGGWDERET